MSCLTDGGDSLGQAKRLAAGEAVQLFFCALCGAAPPRLLDAAARLVHEQRALDVFYVLAQRELHKRISKHLESRRLDRGDLFSFWFFSSSFFCFFLSFAHERKNGSHRHRQRKKKHEKKNSVSSAFSHLLNLHNLSEEMSTAQHERAIRMGEVGSCWFVWNRAKQERERTKKLNSTRASSRPRRKRPS